MTSGCASSLRDMPIGQFPASTAPPAGERRRKKTASERRRRRMIAYGRHQPAYQDATGTRRRVQALMAAGYPLTRQAVMLGRDRANFWKILRVQRVSTATARQMRALYDRIGDKPPRLASKWEKSASTCARERAAAEGWPGPGGWESRPGPHYIEDPAARPKRGWQQEGGIRR